MAEVSEFARKSRTNSNKLGHGMSDLSILAVLKCRLKTYKTSIYTHTIDTPGEIQK